MKAKRLRSIPVDIMIGRHHFDIEMADRSTTHYGGMGEIHHWYNTIVIAADLVPSKKWSTLLHECMHEISKQRGLGLDEVQIAALGEGIFELLAGMGLLDEREKSKGDS